MYTVYRGSVYIGHTPFQASPFSNNHLFKPGRTIEEEHKEQTLGFSLSNESCRRYTSVYE